ncbi:MAG TPA: hypothetical protein VEQ85_15985 [Lacipirellulaceae bacterium]|nr:hypothetical protein [Lacipirellulaceae bacterium]
MACNLAEVVPEDAPPDVMRAVPDCKAEDCQLQPLPAPTDVYQLLTHSDAQCRAATNATIANMVDLEAHWARIIIECDSKYVQRNLCLLRDLLELRANESRNKSAGAALEAFYQLASLEARRHYLDMAIQETADSLRRAEDLRTADLAVDVDAEAMSAELATLEDRRLQLDFLRLQLNGQLQKLMGCPISESHFFWPEVDWTPDLTPVDADAELAAGLPLRNDLRAIAIVWCNLEKSTLRVARGVLNVADGAIGSVEPTEGLVHRLRCLRCNDVEVDIRCRQLEMFYNDTEQIATAEIKRAAYEVVLQQQRVAHSRESVEGRRAGLYELTSLRDVEDVPVFQISQARTRLYTAEGDLIEQVAALKIAQARLQTAKAALAAECGYSPQLCCEGSCTGACTRCQARTCRPGELPCKCEKCCRE